MNTKVWADSMRSASGLPQSKFPTLRAVEPMTVNPTTKAAPAAKTGRQRMAIHSRNGNTMASGRAVVQGPSGKDIRKTVSAVRMMSAAQPSTSSLRVKRTRIASPKPISSGAAVTTPNVAAPNQRLHTWRGDAIGLVRLMATTAPAAAIADPTAVAVKNHRTRRTSSRLNVLPNHRSSSQAVTRVCTVLKKPKAMESPAFRPIERPLTVDATSTAAATGRRALGPKAINAPAEMPAAGQKIANPGSTRRTKPSRLARKYAMPVATASLTPQNHDWPTAGWEPTTPGPPNGTRDSLCLA